MKKGDWKELGGSIWGTSGWCGSGLGRMEQRTDGSSNNAGLEFQSKSPPFCVSHVKRSPRERHFPLWKIWEHSECKNAGLKNVLS